MFCKRWKYRRFDNFSTLIVKRIKGIRRAALAPILPTESGDCFLLIDGGATADCTPEFLAQFGLMGSIFFEKVHNIKNPRVGLLNIGTEKAKGNELTKSAYPLLEELPINFVGNIEAREAPLGGVDVLVCDGFAGNNFLKLMEGMGILMARNLKQLFSKNILTMLAALFVKSGINAIKKKMDYTEHGGAPLLGIDGAVIKAHGSSNAKAFYHAIRQAKKFYESNVNLEIKKKLQ